MATTKKKTAAKIIKGDRRLTINQTKKLLQIMSALTQRAGISASLGKSFGGDRDLYTALGYKLLPTFADYMGRYKRQDIAQAIIDAPVRACWRQVPEITESEDKPTDFEIKWIDLVGRRSVFHYLSRCDRLSSIGEYAVLLLGFDDGIELNEEVTHASDLLYLMPYSQDAASIDKYDEDTKSERYGQVNQYKINMSVGTSGTSISKQVHWSRVIHVSQGNLVTEVFGIPRLECVLNRLEDLERISGGSAEMFWRGAFPGLAFKLDKLAEFDDQKQSLSELKDQVDEYIHGLRRDLRLQGITVESIAQQVADPSHHVSMLLDLIAAAVRIPKRILMGSERGELASSQDEKNWALHIDGRRQEHCEAKILRPLINRLVDVKVLPKPKEGYTVNWPDILTASDKEKAEVGAIKTKALKDYVDALGAAEVLPVSIFLKDILGFTTDEIEQIDAIVGEQQAEVEKDDALEPTLNIKYPDHIDPVTRRKTQELLDSGDIYTADLIAEFVAACGRAEVDRGATT